MALFGNRKPRPFEHKYIFVDERKERLQDMEKRVKKELGVDSDQSYDSEKIRGKIFEQTKFVRKRHSGLSKGWSYGMIVLLIIGLLVLWHFLAQGL